MRISPSLLPLVPTESQVIAAGRGSGFSPHVDLPASFENDTLIVDVTANGNTLTLTSAIALPEAVHRAKAMVIRTGYRALFCSSRPFS
jgi:hypothetical protein